MVIKCGYIFILTVIVTDITFTGNDTAFPAFVQLKKQFILIFWLFIQKQDFIKRQIRRQYAFINMIQYLMDIMGFLTLFISILKIY